MKAFVTRSLVLVAALTAIGGCSTPRDSYSGDAAATGRTGTSSDRSMLDDFFHGDDEAKTHNSAL